MLRPRGVKQKGGVGNVVPRYENKPSEASPLRKSDERSAANGACSPARDRPASSRSSETAAVCSI